MKTKILYVEDEVFLAKIVKESLESRGYEVQLVSDGAKVMAAFESFEPHIYVLDVMLPNIDGFELGKLLKKEMAELPILYLSAKDQTADVLEGFKSGGNDYIRKPCSLEELMVRIENLLLLISNKLNVVELSELVTIGDFNFHSLKYQLTHRKGTVINLSYKEVELLKLLASNINQELERQVILEKVWGDDSIYNSRSLDVYINKLRGYFKKDEKIKLITLRGVGYLFSVDGKK